MRAPGRRSGMRLAVPILLASALIAACGSADPDSGDVSDRSVPTATDTAQEPEALTASTGLTRAAADPKAPVDELAAGFNDAGFDLLRTLPAGENIVFSPTSIGHALLMASAAGDDTTRTAIEAALELPDRAHEAWNTLDGSIAASQSDEVTVTIADRIWPRLDIEPDQAWIDLLATQHGADVVPLDFADETEASRQIINDWVSDRTEALIPDLLPEGFIDPATVMVLTDTLYFAADWQRPFGKYGPVEGTFTTLDGTETDVSFMQELELADRRGVGDGFVGAEIPYAGNDYSMLVLVPDEGRFGDVVDRLDQQLLDEIDATFTTGPYELLLPTWDDAYQIDLLEWLVDIGAAPGSYPKISPDAFLDAAVHAADIAVDEQGTVAAAATALGFADSGPPDPELTVAADRPFVYLIRHRDSGLVLFAGQVTDPT